MSVERTSDVVRIACVPLNQIPLDWSGNRGRILSALRELKSQSPEIVLFPELCVTGYGCEDAFYAPYVAERALASAIEIAREAESILSAAILIGIPYRFHERIYNCAAVIRNGRIECLIPKQNLAGDGIHYEPRWFTAWRQPVTETEIAGRKVPIGPVVLEADGLRFALEICEDCWVPNRPADRYTEASPDLILCPSASHFAFGKETVRRNIALDSSRAYACAYAMVNLLGNESGRAIYDGCVIVASLGNLIYEGKRFSYKDYTLHTIDIDVAAVRAARGRLYSFKEQNETPDYGLVDVSSSANLPARPSHSTAPGAPDSLSKEQEFLEAVTLGLFDYLRKSHSRGYVISLSGGADSAACAVLVERMIRLAVRELGPEEFQRKLRVAKSSPSDLLHTIYQAAAQSSQTTRTAAREVARALGADHHEADISDTVERYTEKIQSILGRTLTWETDDLPLQNIQARVRSPLAWFFANTTGSILITTSNRSEGSVGYCTMDGDTSGGLAPIAGVDKAYLKQWLIWMEKTGDEFGPVGALKYINEQEPTAELRANQTDERDLMPYVLLDRIEALAIRDKKSPREIFEALREGVDASFLKKSIARFFRLWTQNQWKRERIAPSFHLDDRNIDPRSWMRFPILSAGYAEEIEEMESA